MFPRQQPPPQPEPEVEPDYRVLSEYEELVAYRTLYLLELGFLMEQIMVLPLHRADIGHTAENLLKRGAPHSYVVLELRED